MADKDREKWNKKYKEGSHIDFTPSDIVKKFYKLAKVGKALDLACGVGRNAIFLAEKGFEVDAIDISDVAINVLKEKQPNVNAIVADLDNYKLEENKYDLIVDINFLNRNLIPFLKTSLKNDGLIIFETFVISEKRKNKSFYLMPNELIHMFLDFQIVFYEEKSFENGEIKASLVARKVC